MSRFPALVAWGGPFSVMLPDKVMKLMALALDPGAADGEWSNAAVKAISLMRSSGLTVDLFRRQELRQHEHDEPTMPFGKYKGHTISSLPDWYLEWIIANCQLREPLKTVIERAYQQSKS